MLNPHPYIMMKMRKQKLLCVIFYFSVLCCHSRIHFYNFLPLFLFPHTPAISQDGRLTTNAYMAEYNQDRFELDIQAKEVQPPERIAVAKVFVSIKSFRIFLLLMLFHFYFVNLYIPIFPLIQHACFCICNEKGMKNI